MGWEMVGFSFRRVCYEAELHPESIHMDGMDGMKDKCGGSITITSTKGNAGV